MLGAVLGGWGERLVARLGLRPPLLCHRVAAHQRGEVDGEVAAQQRFAGGDGEQRGQQINVEFWLEQQQPAVYAGAPQVGRVLGKVDLSQFVVSVNYIYYAHCKLIMMESLRVDFY